MNIKLAGGISCTESAFRDPLKLSGMLCGWITPARNVNNTQATAQTKYGNIVTSGSQAPHLESLRAVESRAKNRSRKV